MPYQLNCATEEINKAKALTLACLRKPQSVQKMYDALNDINSCCEAALQRIAQHIAGVEVNERLKAERAKAEANKSDG